MRILVVEDEALVAFMLEDILADLGCEVVGPALHVDAALGLASEERIDAALLDVNLGGSDVYPVARKLEERRIPFAFVTGYAFGDTMGKYRSRPTVAKPFQATDLQRVLKAILK